MSEEWSDWFLHDGRGCPCVGEVVMIDAVRNQLGDTGMAGPLIAFGGTSWKWATTGISPSVVQQIIRYRIRKPKGLTILEGLLENLPKEMEVAG